MPQVADRDQPVTLGQFAAVMSRAPGPVIQQWHPFVVQKFAAYDITTDVQQAAILASMANETGQLMSLQEASYFNTDFDYLRNKVFPGVFGLTRELFESWKKLGRDGFDVAFFNHVYADANRPARARLGNIHPGDGWKYRGQGPNQLTGLGNFMWMARKTGLPLVENPAMIQTPPAGCLIMCLFWRENGCNEMVSDGSQAGFLRAMQVLNPGLPDFSHHLAFWDVARRALANDTIVDMPEPMPIQAGRDATRALQEQLSKLGYDTGGIDGIAGPRTRAAILAFQAQHQLEPDGVVGPRTRAALALALEQHA